MYSNHVCYQLVDCTHYYCHCWSFVWICRLQETWSVPSGFLKLLYNREVALNFKILSCHMLTRLLSSENAYKCLVWSFIRQLCCLDVNWGSSSAALLHVTVLRATYRLQQTEDHVKNFRCVCYAQTWSTLIHGLSCIKHRSVCCLPITLCLEYGYNVNYGLPRG